MNRASKVGVTNDRTLNNLAFARREGYDEAQARMRKNQEKNGQNNEEKESERVSK